MRSCTFDLTAGQSIAIPPASVVFLRRGTAEWRTPDGGLFLDGNHVLLVPQTSGAALVAANESAALALLRCASVDAGRETRLLLADSRAFLDLYRVSLNKRDADEDAPFCELISTLVARAAVPPRAHSPHSYAYAREIQRYVNANVGQPIALRDAARACSLSPFTASRVFHRETGIPLRTYVRRVRLRTALSYVAAKHDLSQVALALGFFDHAHFTKSFRAEFGITPSEWRDIVTAAVRCAA